MDELVTLGWAMIPYVLTIIVVVAFLWGSHKVLLGNKSLSKEAKLPRKIILLVLYIMGVIVIASALPVTESTRNQVISLIGLLLSGVIAFSSTTIVANIMAGVVLRFTQPFRTGDFIRVDGFFGRVTEKGVFDTEIQTEQRELISFTNSYLMSHPLQVVRSSGTIISASLSLGYDIHHSRIEPLLIKAAELSELEGPFVQITELGDHAITYRISGLLTEVKSMISSRSKLYTNILDCLHEEKVEIVSPKFMNQRKLPDGEAVIPHSDTTGAQATSGTQNAEETLAEAGVNSEAGMGGEAGMSIAAGQNNIADQTTNPESALSKDTVAETKSTKQPKAKEKIPAESMPEDIIFDKAEEAVAKEQSEMDLLEKISRLETELKEAEGESKDLIKNKINRLLERIKALHDKENKSDET
ncbi:MAG: small conductance mechanosensitive channel [Glaciecola sp.]|jgi:small conductance mechanosensitive channel